MEFVEYLADALGSVWALWAFGLVASYRLIAPAQGFVSEEGLAWITARLAERRFAGLTRRFSVSFKRYVDRVFGARQRRIGRCRVWTLRYADCALVSLLTFLAIFWMLVLSIDSAVLMDGFSREIEALSTQLPGFPVAEALESPQSRALMIYGGLGVFSLSFGLANTLVDYLSFLETRNVLARMGRRVWIDVSMIGVDVVLTASIAAAGIAAVFMTTTLAGTVFTGRDIGAWEAFLAGFLLVAEALRTAWGYLSDGDPGVGFGDIPATSLSLSTFATSIWIWVFLSGTLLLRLVVLARPLMDAVVFFVDIEKHPFRAIWLVFAVAWTGAMAVFAAL